MHITDELDGYFLDRAVTLFGLAVEESIHEISNNCTDQKRAEYLIEAKINEWLSTSLPEDQEQKFADPFAKYRKSPVEEETEFEIG